MAILDDKNIADDHQDEQVLRGIQPRHQKAFKFYKGTRALGIFGVITFIILFILTKIQAFQLFTAWKIYRYGTAFMLVFGIVCFLLAYITKLIFLRRAPFDDWVFEIAEKRLGTSIIFYDSKQIYINYDRGGKEVDKKEFVTEMSDKSIHYSYFYTKTDIDQGYIVVECKRREPIPTKASFKPDDDKFWNIIPMGLTINPVSQRVSPIGWYINDINKNEELYETTPSTSILICGGTGCFDKDTPIPMYDTLVR